MKLKTLLLLTIGFAFLASCSRVISPYQAANGKAKCGRSIR